MKLRFSSLRYRIAATIFVLEAVMMALVLSQTLTLSVQASRNQQLAHEEATLNAASEISRNALLWEEYSELLPYTRSVPYVGGVTHAFVADQRNVVVASTDVALLGQPIPRLQSSNTEFWRTRDIANQNEKLGTLAIRFSNAKLLEAIKGARNLGIWIAITGMVIIAVIGMLIGFLLTRRLGILASAAQRIAQGDLTAKTGLQGDDEVAEVGRAFDQMAAKIREHITAIEESNTRFALAVRGSNDGIWDWDIATDKTYFSPRWKEMLGFDESDPDFQSAISNWFDRIHPEDSNKVQTKLYAYLHNGAEFFALEHRLQTKTGKYIWVLMRGKALRNNEGKAIRMTGSLSDITDRKQQESTIQHQAMHDAMTNLPNRSVMHDCLRQAILDAEGRHESLAVLMLDIDRFKEINDTLGHHAGDAVLREMAVRLQMVVRKSDVVARFGGDEFTIMLPGMDAVLVVPLINKIIKSLEPSIVVDQHRLHIETSVGVSLYPQHGRDATSLIRFADVAMYIAKHDSSGYAIYDPGQDQHNANRLSLTTELRLAIEADELVLHYQPKIELS